MKLAFFVVVSLFLHVCLYLLLDDFSLSTVEKKPAPQIFNVQIVEPVEEEPEPEIPPLPSYDAGAADIGAEAIGNEAPAPPITMPEINIPKLKNTDSLNIKIPKLNLGEVSAKGTLDADKQLLSEIDAVSDKYHRSNVETAGSVSSGKKVGTDDGKDFFVIKNLSGSRKLVTIPEKPVFSLSSNTNVRVSFKVDREGSTHTILLLNRTDAKIERLAIDFVQKLKFNAVLDSNPESAEIILYFRVR